MADKSKFNLSDFKASIKANGVARSTRFELNVHPPLGVRSYINSRELSIRCNTGALPPMNVRTKDFQVGQGQLRKMPTGYDQGHTLTFTFYNDAKSEIYNGLLKWSKFILASQDENDYAINYYNEFVGTIDLSQLDEMDQIRYSYTLFDAYPIKVDAVQLDSSHVNEAQTIKVEFAYRYARSQKDISNDLEAIVKKKYRPAIATTGADAYIARDRQYRPKMDSTITADYDEDPSLFVRAKTQKGVKDTIPLIRRYQQCTADTMAARFKGEGIKEIQALEWPERKGRLKGLIAEGKKDEAVAESGGLASFFKTLSDSVSGFFADTKDAKKQYADMSKELPATDPLHKTTDDLKSTYTDVATSQTAINSEFYKVNKDLDKLINPTKVTLA